MPDTTNLSLRNIHARDLKSVVKDIPTLPVIYQQLFTMMQDPNVAIPRLSELISQDQALSAKVLHLVNSAFYGHKKRITTINRALVILGFRAIRNAALAISVFDYFKGEEGSELCDLHRFWEHSIAVGSVSKVLATHTAPMMIEEAFVVGLLHDVGKVIMKKYFPADFDELVLHLHEKGGHWLGVENELFGINHAQIGKAIFRSWNFPPSIVEAVRFHHMSCSNSSFPQLAALVNIADWLTHKGKRALPLGDPPDSLFEESLTTLGITLEEAMEPVKEYNEEISYALDLIKLVED